jgi:hypothetical protein
MTSATLKTSMEAPKKVFGDNFGLKTSSFGLAAADKPGIVSEKPVIFGEKSEFGG